MVHSAGRVKRIRRSRGETLVETIVSFAVLLILLTLVTSVVKAGIGLNNRAIANTLRLNEDCAGIELSVDGSGLTPVPDSTNTELLLTYAGETGSETVRITLSVWQAGGGILRSFTTHAVTPVGGGG